MKVILDEGVPKQLTRYLQGHAVATVPEAGWESARNGLLLELIETAGYGVFVTCDKNLEYQQHQLDRKPFGILILSTNHWPSMQPYIERVIEAIQNCTAGSISRVQCGHFVPTRFRKPMT